MLNVSERKTVGCGNSLLRKLNCEWTTYRNCQARKNFVRFFLVFSNAGSKQFQDPSNRHFIFVAKMYSMLLTLFSVYLFIEWSILWIQYFIRNYVGFDCGAFRLKPQWDNEDAIHNIYFITRLISICTKINWIAAYEMKLNFWHIQSRKQIKTQDLWFRYEINIGWLVVKNNTAQKTRVITWT